MTNPLPVTCPKCGTTMNHHAEKLVEPRDANEAKRAIAALGGMVEEIHTCPVCGAVSMRAGA